MRARAAHTAVAVLLLSLAACGGTDEGAGAPPVGGDGTDAAVASDTGLNASVTVDTQPLPGDTAAGAR